MNDFTQGPVSFRAHGLSVLGSLVLLYITILLVRKGYLKSGYSILWFIIAISILILSIFTDALFFFTQLTGIYYAPAAIFSVLIVGIILIAIQFSTVLTKHERRIKRLAQENALLKKSLDKAKKKS